MTAMFTREMLDKFPRHIFKAKRKIQDVHELRGFVATAAVLIALGWPI